MPYLFFETRAFANNLDPEHLKPASVFDGDIFQQPVLRADRFNGPLIRRPIAGIQLKERRPANLQVLQADGSPIIMHNSLGASVKKGRFSDSSNQVLGSNLGGQYYTDFTLLQVRETRQEKVQVVETFGEDFAFFFGEQPRFLACAGLLVNSYDFNWRAEFWENYDKYLRGTKLVEQKARAYLNWDDILVEGYMISAQAVDSATDPHTIPIQFTMLVTGYVSIASLNFSELAKYRDALALSGGHNEIIGSRAADVTSNGAFVNISEDFWLRQLEAIFDLDNPEQAVMALINTNPKKLFEQTLENRPGSIKSYMLSGGPAVNLSNERFPATGPVKYMFANKPTQLHDTSRMAKSANTRKLLGDTFTVTNHVIKVGL